MTENQKKSGVGQLEELLTQAHDRAWLAKATSNPGLVSMWLGKVRTVLTSIYGADSAFLAKLPQLRLPASPQESVVALEASVSVLGGMLATLLSHRSAAGRVGEPKVFIGHGGSPVWLLVKDFLTTRLRLQCEEFNSAVVAGVPTSERLFQMLDEANFAFLIMTPEDQHLNATRHARENVVHEVGLFQGRLGARRAIVLLEHGCEEFSNVHGLGQIRFPEGHVSAAFEEMRRVLEREGIIPFGETAKTVERPFAISSDARNLLAAAVAGDGTITDYTVLAGRFIQANGTSYGGNPRETAKWVAGLEQLVEERLVDANGNGIHHVTDLGYRTADTF